MKAQLEHNATGLMFLWMYVKSTAATVASSLFKPSYCTALCSTTASALLEVVTAVMSDTGTSKACVEIFTTAADKEENTPLSLKIALPGHRSRGQSDIVNANICAEPLQMPRLQIWADSTVVLWGASILDGSPGTDVAY